MSSFLSRNASNFSKKRLRLKTFKEIDTQFVNRTIIMNKLIILLGVSILCAAGCAPTYQTSVVTPVPATAIIVPPPPKAGVIDMPDQHVQHVSVKKLSTIDVYPGSLKENIERIAKHYGWRQVVWDAPEDYRWVGKARITKARICKTFCVNY